MRSHSRHLEAARAKLDALHEAIEDAQAEILRLRGDAAVFAQKLATSLDEYAAAEKAAVLERLEKTKG